MNRNTQDDGGADVTSGAQNGDAEPVPEAQAETVAGPSAEAAEAEAMDVAASDEMTAEGDTTEPAEATAIDTSADLAADSEEAFDAHDETPTGEQVQLDLPNLDGITVDEFVDPIEAIIFAAGEPVVLNDIKRVLERTWVDDHPALKAHKLSLAKDALKLLKKRWAAMGDARGFSLVEVADGMTFRSNSKWANYLRSTREDRPVRMSRPALETLAIIAYRQPATKPEIDHIRGVDCGATIRLLLDRNLVRIVGKREEPGRPMLYGTTKEFLSFFNLPSLGQLPSLREFSELTEESQEEISTTLGEMPSLDDLSRNAKKLRLDEEPEVQALDEAVRGLDSTENKTREAFASQGISIDPAAEIAAEPVVTERETGT